METINYIYTGIITVFSLGCIIYGIRLAIKTRKENIDIYDKNRKQRKEDFNDYGTKY